MKKFFVCLFSVALMTCVLTGLTGCSDDNSGTPTSYNVGDNVFIYPSCNFAYKVDDNFTIEITELSATVTQKHTISSNDELSSPYFPYTISIKASGTLQEATNKCFMIRFSTSPSNLIASSPMATDEAGKISWVITYNSLSLDMPSFCFHDVVLS